MNISLVRVFLRDLLDLAVWSEDDVEVVSDHLYSRVSNTHRMGPHLIHTYTSDASF